MNGLPRSAFVGRYERYRGKGFTFLPAAAAGEDGYMSFEGGGLGGALTSVTSMASGVRVYDFSAWLKRTVGLDDTVV